MSTKLLILFLLASTSQTDKVAYYEKIISEAYKNGATYQWPKSANEYCSDERREEFGSYDFIIIGAGAGGTTIANRLSEIENWNVLELEAGGPGDDLTEIPDMYTPIEFTHFNWAYNSTTQKTACLGLIDQVCLYPRGKGLGGSTLINGLVYARGYRSDFEKWAKIAGDKRWGYDSVLKYFKKSENFVHNDPDAPFEPSVHGKGGYLRVEYHKPRSPLLDAFLAGNKELGFGIVDYNANKLGASPSQLNTDHGRRLDGAKAFLDPVKNRQNLKILTHSYVTKIRFDKRVATGVEFSRNGKNYFVEVKKEVILAAGAFGTPQILMLSGIGPKKHLQDLKIDVIADLEVGSTLLDNPTFFGINVGTNYTEPVKPLRDYVKEYLDGVGPLAIPNSNQGVGFYESDYSKGTGSPDIELEFIPANASNPLSQRSFGFTDQTYEDVWKDTKVPQSLNVYVIDLHAQSSGTVRLKSKNPYDYPLINSNFISDPENRDIHALYEGIQLVLKLLQTKPFKSLDAKLQGCPLRACKKYEYLSRAYWYCALRQLTVNLYHPLGTCPMGTDPKTAVVDSQLKVFGFENLRVADASVFPLTLAGHPNAPTVMVGEQADIQHVALSYESEDEMMARMHHKGRRGTAHYSKQDIREQYCISDRGLGALESDRQSLFGCLSSHQSSPCSNRASFLTACVRQKVPSDENLYDLYRRHPAEYAPYPRRSRYPWGPLAPEIYRYDEDLKSSYFRRKVHTDPSRYTWMPSDDESVRMEKPRSILEPYHSNQPAPSTPVPSKKHVSFARSHTMASFDDAMASLSSSSSHLNRMTRSQERLLDVRKAEGLPITRQPEPSDNLLMLDKVKRAPMKTQATQTEACLGRKPLPPGNINLSPRTIHRVKMVSQGAQTNGFLVNGRKLIKSFSEAGTKFCKTSDYSPFETILDHEPLQRTQSDEPPRSPFIVTSPPHLLELPSDSSSLSHESEDSESKKEIFIDFKPQLCMIQGKMVKRPLTKTVSDGEMLLGQRKTLKIEDVGVVIEKALMSFSHENIALSEDEQRTFIPYFQNAPIRHEGICRPLEDNVYSSLSFEDNNFHTQDSIDEEFHENLIYNRMYMRQESNEGIMLEGYSPNDECVVPSVCLLPGKLSPFASSDSLANDIRDHSDGIWNESQATVLQVDSGTDNGTALSSSEMTSVTSPGSAILLTPSSRRKHLLMMQHQQRSSMDTEALEEEFVEQGETSPRIIIERPSKTLEPPCSIKQQYLTPQRTISPSPAWRRRTPEPPSESPLPAVVPDLLLARTDSCKTNTDVSESTTTDDYITANSGTDSSRKSGSTKGVDFYNLHAHMQDGSSFESNKGDIFTDDMVVPSFSPPLILEEAHTLSNTPVPEVRTGRSTPSDTSSSCGSYSVDGSCPDLLERSKVPSANKTASEEERSRWKSEPKPSKRRPFTLDISKHQDTYTLSPNSKHKTYKSSPSSDKPKRAKSRTRSPMQAHKKHYQVKKSVYGRVEAGPEESKATSDESSCDFGMKYTTSQTSPRKGKKIKDNNRRKSLPRSPTGQRAKKSNFEEKPSSLPGSLSRRKSAKSKLQPEDAKSTLALYSPAESPKKRHSPDTTKLKALSAESLRSVSPGSDSVFYSDPSSHTADHQVHCLHCGKEVDIVTTDDPDKSASSNGAHQDIVQPPAGFEDSPRAKHGTTRLYKKLDRRFRSEDRSQTEYRRHRYKPDVRAKSEERGAKTYRAKLRPMAKSTDNSQEVLKATDSSPSVLPGAPEDEDDQGVYDVPYMEGCWIYIDERDEVQTWSKSGTPTELEASRRGSVSSTESEQEFRKRYQAVTHRMVHRKSCLEMYKRQTSRSFECDKTVVVHRESGEFGFRIHGSKPVVVSAIEPGTPAETSGLEVGDIVLAVNGVSVLDKSHSEVVKIAHAGSDTLSLEVARTCYALNSPQDEHSSSALYSGYLWKLSGYASGTITNKWIRRWFCLKQNNCLYYYKTDSEKQPVGVVMLFDHEIKKQTDDEEGLSKPYRFVIHKPEAVPLRLAADNGTALNRWVDVVGRAISDSQTVDEFLETTKKNMGVVPSSISDPDCFGYLVKLGTQWKSWSKRYCVLKDACLYFYQDAAAKAAFGVAYLQGYRVQQSITGSKKHAFEIIPPEPSKKHFYFHTESDADRKRWIAALEYSIDRWLKIQ